MCSTAHMKRADNTDVTISMQKIFISLDGKSITPSEENFSMPMKEKEK